MRDTTLPDTTLPDTTLPDTALPDFPFPAGPLGSASPAFDVLRAAAPVCPVRLPSGDVIDMVTRFEDVEAVHRAFSRDLPLEGTPEIVRGESATRGLSSSVTTMDPPDHTRVRSLIGPSFAPRRMAAWRPAVEGIAAELVAGMRAGGAQADLVTAYCLELPVRVICRILGVAPEEMPNFRMWTEASMSTISMPVGERVARTEAFLAFVGGLVEQRRAEPGTGLVDELIAAQAEDGDRLSDEELVGNIVALIIAGHETTATMLARGTVTLLRHPEVLAEVRADATLWPRVVEELLRFDTPMTAGLFRVASEDTTLPSGAVVPRGRVVVAPTAAGNMDPDRFSRPRVFDIHRPDNRHLGFGQGPHFCVGAALARLEMQVGFEVLFGALPGLRLLVAPEDLEWITGTRMLALRALPVAWDAEAGTAA